MRIFAWIVIISIFSGVLGLVLQDNHRAAEEGKAAAKNRSQLSCVTKVTRGSRAWTMQENRMPFARTLEPPRQYFISKSGRRRSVRPLVGVIDLAFIFGTE